MRFLLSVIIAVIMFLPMAGAAQAFPKDALKPYQFDSNQQEHTTAILYAVPQAITVGEDFSVVLRLEPLEGWHTYWVNPGDSGLATSIEWTLPTEFSAGEIHWPVPERLPIEPLVNYGYEGAVDLEVRLTAPENLTQSEYTFTAKARWLVCEEICIPEQATLEITLPVAAQTTIVPEMQDWLQQVRSTQPIADDTLLLDVGLSTEREAFIGIKLVEIQQLYPSLSIDAVQEVVFFPLEPRQIQHSAPQEWQQDAEKINITTTAERAAAVGDVVRGVLRLDLAEGKTIGFVTEGSFIEMPATMAGATSLALPMEMPSAGGDITIWSALLFAFIGGIILNIMPCVFPVLSLKALSISKMHGQDKAYIRLEGLAYTAGVLVFFTGLAILLLIIQQTTASIGWGFQMQSPPFVAILALLVFMIGLNLSGFFEVPSFFANTGTALTAKQGLSGSFFTGALAAIVATPCTAPFMGAAIGFALAQPPLLAVSIFLALGFGLALPFLLISFSTTVQRALPKPGAWMQTAKQLLAFPMYLTAVWLLWVFALQTQPTATAALLLLAVLVVFALWLGGKVRSRFLNIGLGIGLIVLFLTVLQLVPASSDAQNKQVNFKNDKLAFSQEVLEESLATGRPVFVNATAAWCITCKVNEANALQSRRVQQAFQEFNFIYIEADWTDYNDEIGAYLAQFGRRGVPLYVVYPAQEGEPVLLPQLLTPSLVVNALEKAGNEPR